MMRMIIAIPMNMIVPDYVMVKPLFKRIGMMMMVTDLEMVWTKNIVVLKYPTVGY